MTINDYNQAVNLYADRLFRFVLKNIKDKHMAEDLVQDSYEKLWKNMQKVDGKKVKAYLFTTAYHTMIDRIRREKRETYTDGNQIPETGYEITYSDLKEVLNEGLNRQPEVQRMVLLLRDYEGYSYQEIGEIAGLSESQVKVYIYRARVFLKNYIGKPETVI